MPPRSRSATRQRLQLLLGDDSTVLFAAACAGRSRRLRTSSAVFATVALPVMAVPEALSNTTKMMYEVRHGCRDRSPRLFSELRLLFSLPLPEAHVYFLLCDAQACDPMDEAFYLQATTDGHLDVSDVSRRFALRLCSLTAVWLRGS